jgi:Transglycosylase SLT domain
MLLKTPLFFLQVLVALCLYALPSCSFAQTEKPLVQNLSATNSCSCFIYDSVVYAEGWHLLPQTKYWQVVMGLSPDSAVVSVANSRQMVGFIAMENWNKLTEIQKKDYRDSIRHQFGIADSVSIYITTGKNSFYDFEKVKPSIQRAIKVFADNGVDPWYAQAILLIESPGKTDARSSVGANGPFQLMSSVAKMEGLIVNQYVDERTDIDKAAYAASRLLKRICIPKVREMLDCEGVAYVETDLWFRLLVLHAYHAGAGNLGGVIRKIGPCEGGMPLVQMVWTTTYKGFKNSSQNYSQLALAAYCNFHQIMQEEVIKTAEIEAELEADKDWK